MKRAGGAIKGGGKRHAPEPGQVAHQDPALAAEAADEELDALGIPSGWVACPPMGAQVAGLVPMKVPLGSHFDSHIPAQARFHPDDAGEAGARARGAPIAMVIDLTRSSRYYDPRRWLEAGVQYVKIPCRGRGQAPEPEAVNDFCWEVNRYRLSAGENAAATILVHCTHGFNRSGYMLASYLVRTQGMPVWRAVREFAAARPPGIYKEYYIRELFRYYHEDVPAGFPFPGTPEWKGGGSPDRGDAVDASAAEEAALASLHMEHDDVIGEPVGADEAAHVCGCLSDLVRGPEPGRHRAWFPGSQPVSLARSNLGLVLRRRYWVTWKADGTRFMLLLLRSGAYLVDRKLLVRRLQLRFPMPEAGRRDDGSGGGRRNRMPPLHDLTLMDGEMVIDEDAATGKKSRRFLAYDLMAVAGHSLARAPWKTRYALLQRDVMAPRQAEREAIAAAKTAEREALAAGRAGGGGGASKAASSRGAAGGVYPYRYEDEPIRVRRKEFWPLTAARSLLDRFIPSLPHEADGLIFQGYEDPYVAGTCEELLKWKFPHLNSVDFRLRVGAGEVGGSEGGTGAGGPGKGGAGAGGAGEGGTGLGGMGSRSGASSSPSAHLSLELLETRSGPDAPRRRGFHALPDAKVSLPEGLDPRTLNLRIVECTWDPDAQSWRYLRERRDKDTPNAYHVFEKVQDSILLPVRDADLLSTIDRAVMGKVYAQDAAVAKKASLAKERHGREAEATGGGAGGGGGGVADGGCGAAEASGRTDASGDATNEAREGAATTSAAGRRVGDVGGAASAADGGGNPRAGGAGHAANGRAAGTNGGTGGATKGHEAGAGCDAKGEEGPPGGSDREDAAEDAAPASLPSVERGDAAKAATAAPTAAHDDGSPAWSETPEGETVPVSGTDPTTVAEEADTCPILLERAFL